MLHEMEDVLRLPSKHQLLSYDTTFSLGEFYVSPLLYRHNVFNNDPVMMAAAFLASYHQ